MKSIEEASREILEAFQPVGEERVALLDSLGRFLAQPFVARSDLPSFDNSAMDGYAVRASEVGAASESRPVCLPVRGESRAGGPPPTALCAGSAMRIFTGAMLPAEADAVVLQEDTTREADNVSIRVAPRSGANVRARGSDLRAGQIALAAGSRIGPGEIALLASQDAAQVVVLRKPRVAIVSTGDELREIGDPARPGSIVNSNAYALCAQVKEAGADPWIVPSVPDLRDAAAEAFRTALAADVIVISGGVSVGDYDVVRDALADAGIELEFWKIRMKPGKPVSFAKKGRVPVLGLPGNPVSAWVTFELFVRPGLRKMLGDREPFRRRVQVRLSEAHKHGLGRTELARARLVYDAEGRAIAHLAPRQGSGSLPALSAVDALVVLPAEKEHFGTDELLEALVLCEPPHPRAHGH